jgi:5-methylcytosine-specific restriction endonuclease McrA
MTEDLKRQVRRRARYRCEYCQLPQSAWPVRHQVEHIIAEQHEGDDEPSNLALACAHWNGQTWCLRLLEESILDG